MDKMHLVPSAYARWLGMNWQPLSRSPAAWKQCCSAGTDWERKALGWDQPRGEVAVHKSSCGMPKSNTGSSKLSQKQGGALTDGLQDQCIRCHRLPVQAHDCPDHPIPEADAEFAILVPTCSKGQGPGCCHQCSSTDENQQRPDAAPGYVVLQEALR